MADVVRRLRILRALTTWLEGVDCAMFGLVDENGAPLASMEGRVFRGRLAFGNDGEALNDPIPMLSILETPIPLEDIPPQPDSANTAGEWELVVQGFCANDPENPTDPAHVLMAAVKHRLAQAKRLTASHDTSYFGLSYKAVHDLRFGGGVVRPPEAPVSSKAYFWLALTLKISEDHLNPFTD